MSLGCDGKKIFEMAHFVEKVVLIKRRETNFGKEHSF